MTLWAITVALALAGLALSWAAPGHIGVIILLAPLVLRIAVWADQLEES